jgi:hypothetical protein
MHHMPHKHNSIPAFAIMEIEQSNEGRDDHDNDVGFH